MAKIDNKKMWEAIEKLLDVADAIKVSLNKQGLQWNGKEIVSIKPELTPLEATKEKSELTEFEETLFKIVNSYKGKEMHTEGAKAWAKELLSIARKQFIEEACDWLKYTEIGAFPYKLIEEFRKDLGKG